MRALLAQVFAAFRPDSTEDQARLMHAALQAPIARLAFTTDGFVVTPLEFPGGDIGKLAVCGTVNDLAVGGARPSWLSAAFISEEGCEIALLQRIAATMTAEADRAGVKIVTGDTKVVERGKGDGDFVTTSDVGVIDPGVDTGAHRIRPGDAVIVNGVLGDHAAAILAARGDLALQTDLTLDHAGPGRLMQAALPHLHAARDCTRGGQASALCELAGEAGVAVEIDEALLPLRPEVVGVCEILGLNPLYLANDGRLVAFCPEAAAPAVLAAMRALPEGQGATVVGRVKPGPAGQVALRTRFRGGRRIERLAGDQLTRIC